MRNVVCTPLDGTEAEATTGFQNLQPSFPCKHRARADMEGLLGHGNPDFRLSGVGNLCWQDVSQNQVAELPSKTQTLRKGTSASKPEFVVCFHDFSTVQGYDSSHKPFLYSHKVNWVFHHRSIGLVRPCEVVPPPKLASTFWPPWQGPNGTLEPWDFG